jgi:hypothetical protein
LAAEGDAAVLPAADGEFDPFDVGAAGDDEPAHADARNASETIARDGLFMRPVLSERLTVA